MNARAFYMSMVGSVFLLAGWGFTFIGVDQLHEAVHSTEKPVEITAAQLRSYKPGSNLHITLTDFVPYEEGIVVYATADGDATSVWVPVLPADAPKDDPKQIVAVVQLSKISDEVALENALARSRWTGLLHSQGDLHNAADILRFNPGINLKRCWVMGEGHRRADGAGAIPMVIVCPCLFVLGMVMAVVAGLFPATAPSAGSTPHVGMQFIAFNAIGDGVRWLQRRGLLSGGTAVILAVVGLAASGWAAFELYTEWDNTVRVMTVRMMLTITAGLFGLAFVANAVLIGFVSRKAAAAAEANPYQLANADKPSADLTQKAKSAMAIGAGLLVAAGLFCLRGDTPQGAIVSAALGGVVLAAGAIWYVSLRSRVTQEQTQFWN